MFQKVSLWLGRLSVGRKLTLIYLLDLTAVIYVSGILIHEKFLAIDFARKEIVGAAYTDVVRGALMDSFMVRSIGDAKANSVALESVRDQHDEELKAEEASQRFSQSLAALSDKDEAARATAIARGRELLTVVGNQSNLILDPDLDSYYVMSLTVLRFPELLQVLFETHQFMQKWGRRIPGQSNSAEMLTLVGRLEAVLTGVESDYAQAGAAAEPALRDRLQSSRNALLQVARHFAELVLSVSRSELNVAQITSLNAPYQATLLALNDVWRAEIVELHGLLQHRVDGLFSRMWLHLGTAAVLLGFIVSLVYIVASQIARPLQALARVADAVRRSSDYTHRAHWHSRDEIGQLVNAFNDMLAQLDRDRLTQQELAASARAAEAQRQLVEAIPIPMVVTSIPDHEVLHANTPALPWLGGHTLDPWRVGLEPGVRSRFFQRLSDSGAVDEFEVRWMAGGAPAWAVLSARRLEFQGRDAVLTSFTPINQLKMMEQRLELWAKVFEASSESIIIMDESRRIVSVNRAFCRSTSFDFYEVVGKDISFMMDSVTPPTWGELKEQGAWQGEVRIRKQSGGSYPAWLMVSAVQKNATSGEVVNYIGISIDITDRKAKEERIQFLAQHDVLTELPNRALCQQRLAQALEYARLNGERVALLFVDLDRFKLINDTLGHHVGDGLLRTVARRLTQAVRTDDTVSRLGGDEFVVIMRHVSDRAELDLAVNERLIPSIRQSAVIEGNSLTVSCSVGVAIFPDDAADQDELMRRADAAMYEAKAAGRDMARFFSPETDERVLARQTMEGQLRQALANQEFSLHFQPRLNARTRRAQGAEALLRWNNPLLGHVPPANFIPLAEETGLINSIGLWVLQTACHQWREFERQGMTAGLELSVNLSVAQLADPQLTANLDQVLRDSGLAPHQLELELTESHLMDNPRAAQAQVTALKDMGVQIAIDDFGTGYSSLAYLKRFEIDKLKVDQSFVRGMLSDAADAAIVHAVIALGHTLHLKVVAEGVEDLPTAQTLAALGCDELQGYCFSRPLPAADFMEWLGAQDEKPERRRGK